MPVVDNRPVWKTMDKPRNTWTGVRVLITGGSGFIGSVLATNLRREAATVITMDRTIRDYPPGITRIRGDVRDKGVVERMVRGVDVVFHLAGVVGPRQAALRHRETLGTGIVGTANVVDACSEHQCPLIFASTSDVYGIPVVSEMQEHMDLIYGPPQQSRWAYGMTKAIGEQLCWEANRTYALSMGIARLFNVVGPGQNREHGFLFPAFAHAAARGEALHIHGSGEQRRSFMGVREAAMGLMLLGEEVRSAMNGYGECINLGAYETYSVVDVARMFQTIAAMRDRLSIDIVHDKPEGSVPPAKDAPRPDLSNAEVVIGWHPTAITPLSELVRLCYDHARPAPTERAARNETNGPPRNETPKDELGAMAHPPLVF